MTAICTPLPHREGMGEGRSCVVEVPPSPSLSPTGERGKMLAPVRTRLRDARRFLAALGMTSSELGMKRFERHRSW